LSAISRQNTLFVSEEWIKIYDAIQNVDFRAFDHDNYIKAVMSYLAQHHPDKFNDWIASSEFVMKIEVLTWLTQNISYRVDLNARENFLATAERRGSLLQLAQNIAYRVNRVKSASGDVKITSIQTDQPIVDLDGIDLRNRLIVWNDSSNENWFEQFTMIMNAAFSNRTPYGKPLASFTSESIRTDQYVFNSISPDSGCYPFAVEGTTGLLAFDMYNANLDPDTGAYTELMPGIRRALRIFYRQDGNGFASPDTGFFLPIKQGSLSSQDVSFDSPKVVQTLTLAANHINNNDIFIQKINTDEEVVEEWTKVDTVFGEGVSFDPAILNSKKVFEVDTLINDQIRIRFGDGAYGEIPVGTFRIWARTADPNPVKTKTNTLQNKVAVFPYVGADDQVYYLRVAFSLVRDLENGAPSDSNDDIRTRANKVFYTQNRMVTGQDLNNWFLKDDAIRKVHVVNRTYSGHSRYSKLHDPTGLYESVRELGNDGRLFQRPTLTVTHVSADTTRVSTKQIMDQYVKPALAKPDKTQLYYGLYNEIFFPTTVEYRWDQTSIVGTQGLGNIRRGGVVVPVGETGIRLMQYVGADTVLRYDSPNGPVAHVVRVIDDGQASNGIILGGIVPDNAKFYSVFPPMRIRINQSEESEMIRRLSGGVNFGFAWDLLLQEWKVINFNDLDINSVFALDFRGDTTNAFKDASWIIRFEYIADSINGDRWKIVDRGLAMFFESAKDLDFFYINSEPVVDPQTGLVRHDTVQVLGSNEAKTSLRRRGLTPTGEQPCELNAYEFTGDGVETCFQTSETLDPNKIVVSINGVFQVFNIDFTITHSVYGDSVCFSIPPGTGLNAVVRISGDLIPASIRVFSYLITTPSQTEFDLYQPNVIAPNMLVFVDGILQNPTLNFGTGAFGPNSSLVMGEPLTTGSQVIVHYAGNIDSQIFTINAKDGNGATTIFYAPTTSQTNDTVLITIDGVIQEIDKYTLAPDVLGTKITFATAPPLGTVVGIWSVTNPILTKTKRYDFVTNGVTTDFPLSAFPNILEQNILAAVQGVLQVGPYSGFGVWSIVSGNIVRFATAPPTGILNVFVLAGAAGVLTNPRNRTLILNPGPGDITQNGCNIKWIGTDVDFWVRGEYFHDDGYVNSNGVMISPSDLDQDGFDDNPFIYRDLIIQDGFTDLVLWRRTQELGKDIWSPINQFTSPRGTYGRSSTGQPLAGSALAVTINDGDIHYDVSTTTWLVANRLTNLWGAAASQTQYKKEVGRDHLRFIWYHYSPQSQRIDPSPGNIHDVYLLTTAYNQSYRNWLRNNGTVDNEPTAPTPEALRIQFDDHTQFKMLSDSIIFHSTRFKPLFGPQAIPELQAIIKVIPMPGAKIGDNQIRTQVLTVIDDYFDIARWDFGESFYFTELCAFIHSKMASLIQSVVIVPRMNGQAFGKLFQVRSLTDELFVSATQLEDIEIVSSLSDDELRIGSLT